MRMDSNKQNGAQNVTWVMDSIDIKCIINNIIKQMLELVRCLLCCAR